MDQHTAILIDLAFDPNKIDYLHLFLYFSFIHIKLISFLNYYHLVMKIVVEFIENIINSKCMY